MSDSSVKVTEAQGESAWGISLNGEFVSLWLSEEAAARVLSSYERQTKGRWEIVPLAVIRRDSGRAILQSKGGK